MSKPAARTSTALTVAGLTVLGGAVAYALYFDYKRRNDAAFRKQLRKDKKKASKAAAESTPAAPSGAERAALLRTELAKLRKEELPASTQAKEKYFMEQAGLGEQLCTQGPAFAVPAALAFFRALRVYPSPVELLMLYQSTVPPEIFAIIMELTNMDVSEPADQGVALGPGAVPEEPEEQESETSPERSGPPSETSSQDWDKLTDSNASLHL